MLKVSDVCPISLDTDMSWTSSFFRYVSFEDMTEDQINTIYALISLQSV